MEQLQEEVQLEEQQQEWEQELLHVVQLAAML